MKTAVQRYARTMKTAFGKLKIVYEREIKAGDEGRESGKGQTLQQQLNVLQDKSATRPKIVELIEVIAATWAYDGRFGGNDGTTEDVLEKVRQGMKKGRLEVGLHTFGALSGVAGDEVALRASAGGRCHDQPASGRGINTGSGRTHQTEAQGRFVQGSGIALELLSAVWVPKEGEELATGTATIFNA